MSQKLHASAKKKKKCVSKFCMCAHKLDTSDLLLQLYEGGLLLGYNLIALKY